ncbi:MAG: cell division protein FtsQ [Lactobacillaceae bacterium]|nr:cell division protein FtsQ [Lactobacillaceae bacterium]
MLNSLNIRVGTPYWLLKNQENTINNKIKNNEDVKSLKLAFKPEGVLNVLVQENIDFGYVNNDQKWSVLSENGSILKNIEMPTTKAPVYSNFKLKSADLKNTIKQYFELDASIRNSISQVVFVPNSINLHRISFIMRDGNIVYTNSNNFKKKMGFYPQIVSTLSEKDLTNGVIDITGDGFARPIGEQDHNLIEQATNPKKIEEYQKPKKNKKDSSNDDNSNKDSSQESSSDQNSESNQDDQNEQKTNN